MYIDHHETLIVGPEYTECLMAHPCPTTCSQTHYKTQMALYDFPNHAFFNRLYSLDKGK